MFISFNGPLVFTASVFYGILFFVFYKIVSIVYWTFFILYCVFWTYTNIAYFMAAIYRCTAQYGTCWRLHAHQLLPQRSALSQTLSLSANIAGTFIFCFFFFYAGD